MYIHEQAIHSKVVVFSRQNPDQKWEVEILPPIESDSTGHIICSPITYEGKLVAMNMPSLVAEITNSESGRVYQYPIEKCGHFIYKETKYFAIYSKNSVDVLNRRNEYRVSYTNKADIQANINSRVWECMVRDISPTGIGLSIRKDTGFNCAIGNLVSISFVKPVVERLYKVSGTVTRFEEHPNNSEYYVIGCKIKDPNPKWLALVASEQRLELRVRGEKEARR